MEKLFDLSELKERWQHTSHPMTFSEPGHLFILVRHRGCTFCRQSLEQLAKAQEKLIATSFKVALVHMGEDPASEAIRQDYGLKKDIEILSDPKRELYKVFGARRGQWAEVLGAKVIKEGVLGGALFKHGVGRLEGDGFQLGGAYLINEDGVHCLHRPENAADVEDLGKILKLIA